MPESTVPRPRLLEPGLRLLAPGTERYRVRGGGAMVVAMGAGDTLEIIDSEGRQPGELTIFGPAGVNNCDLLGARLRAQGRRVHPDYRRGRPRVHGFPGIHGGGPG